ncbi:MAG: hypothetical protein LBG08_02740 [Spirochaetaceae bacterium]|jgi:hypothetical protein|nr:hypothetical protein [Spirochaetaceae bacterium]
MSAIRGKILIVMVALLFMTQAVFAYELDSRGSISIESDGSGNYWINDEARGICITIVQAQPTGERGVYNFFCSGQSRRRVSNATSLASIIAAASGAGLPGSLATWAAGVIYNEACDIFE